jgi:hypothetical protein
MSPPESASRDRRDETHWKRRAALREVNRRRVNEAIERGTSGPVPVFVCECGNTVCNETLSVPAGNYDEARAGFDHFLVVPGHEIPEVDRVVERSPRYLVVVKHDPQARAVVQSRDGRAE